MTLYTIMKNGRYFLIKRTIINIEGEYHNETEKQNY